MERLKSIIEQYGRWQPLLIYIERIEGFRQTDFAFCIDNSKSMLESIAKEICKHQGQLLEGSESVSKLLSLSFRSLGYPANDTVLQIGTAIANIGQQMGNFRNEIGTVSHGRTMDELKSREQARVYLTEEFLIKSTEIVSCFLIETFEINNPRIKKKEEVTYEGNSSFNQYWDDEYGIFEMGEYSFPASEILFYLDPQAYENELKQFEDIPVLDSEIFRQQDSQPKES